MRFTGGGTSVNEVVVSGCARAATSFPEWRRERRVRHEGLGHGKTSAVGLGAGNCDADRIRDPGRWRGSHRGSVSPALSCATACRRLQVQSTWRPLRAPRGEVGAMLPASLGIWGTREAGLPFRVKGRVARLGRSTTGTLLSLRVSGIFLQKDTVGGCNDTSLLAWL